ncbi:MAG: AAA family ATPase, partial [Acidobacteria bacterium]|nr:AAA family ATPase [Acidobacteriota bacterium]
MIIIHTVDSVPRFASQMLARAVASLPITVVTGARQSGKTTLVRDLAGDPSRRYLTLDDLDVLDQASRSPDDTVARAPRMTLDEVQRAPGLLLAVKRAVDLKRTPGQFVLTGSANLLAMGAVADSLAGRAVYVTLWPLTRREQLGFGQAGLWSALLDAHDDEWLDVVMASDAPPADWHDVVRRGGFPTPAIDLDDHDARELWFSGYLRTYLERDLR